MKKGSVGIGSAVDFLKDNVEKFVFGLAVLVLLFLVVSTFTQEKISFTPDDLQNAATSAKQHVETNNPPIEVVLPPPDETKGPPLPPEAGTLIVDSRMFDYRVPWDGAGGVNKGKRGSPTAELMTVLRASSMVGAIRVKEEDIGLIGSSGIGGSGMSEGYEDEGYGGMGGSSGGNVEGRRFAIVTGLLPYVAQSEQYTNLFIGAEYQNLMMDRPNYVDYTIERAEVTGSGQLQWVDLDAGQVGVEEMGTWAGFGPDVIPPEYKMRFIPYFSLKGMVFPLPQMVNRTFGSEAACPPEIPLLSDAMMERSREQMREMEERRQSQDPSRIWERTGTSSGMGDEGYGSEMMGGEMGYEDESGYGGYGMTSSTTDFSLKPKLFRYLDFTVDAGKSYCYRVKLVLANPNFEVPEQYLETPTDTTIQYLETGFSEASPPVTIPLDSRLLAVSVRSGSRPTDEPTCEMCCIYFDMDDAKESADVFEGLKRGKVVNYLNRPFNEVQALSASAAMGSYGGYEDMEGYGGYGPQGGRPGSRAPVRETPTRIDYKTDVCILDMTGGDRLPGRSRDLVSLGGLLLMGPDGQLEVRTEIDDYEEYSDYEPPERRPRGGSGEGYEDYYGSGEY